MYRRTTKYKRRKTPKDLSVPAQLRKEIINQMRRVFWYYFRPKCLKFYRLKDEQGFYWVCALGSCGARINLEKNAKVDHIQPVVDTETAEHSWDTYFIRLFVPPEKTQILCSVCHADKTKSENLRRIK